MPDEADHFQDRELLRSLDETATDGPTAVLSQVLSGPGGTGKTQLAARRARTLLKSGVVDLVVWVSATGRNTIVETYAEAAHHVVPESVHDSPERAAERFLSWLQTTDKRWLVVLDNLDDPQHIRDLWPPNTPSGTARGRILITTRRTGSPFTGKGRVFVNVDIFTAPESLVYLTQALNDLPVRPGTEDLEGLAEDLGHLPLGLAQASAYIQDRRDNMTCASYRELLRDKRRTLTQLLPEEESLPDNYSATAAATWAISVEHANSLIPRGLAKPMMTLISLLDPDGIPVPVLVSGRARTFLSYPRELSEQDAHDALSALARLSLITRSGHGQDSTVQVHRLVQRAAREHPATAPDPGAAHAAAGALVDGWDRTAHATVLGRRLRSNTSVLREHAENWLWETRAQTVLFRAGESLGESGAVAQAVAHWRDLVAEAESRLGPGHPTTLAAWHNLATWEGEAGDPQAAVRGFRVVIRVREIVLGPDHLDTLAARNNLATWQGRAGDPRAAVQGLRAVLADHERVLGPDHSGTLHTRHNLAHWRREAGERHAAVHDLHTLLTDRERTLGPDHPDTLSARHNLAGWRGESGDPHAAVRDFQALLADRERVLGPDHPDTLSTRYGLASMRGRAGDPHAAAQGLRAVLADHERVLGPNHARTVVNRRNLGVWLEIAAKQEAPEAPDTPDE